MSDIKANDGNAVRREADTPAAQFGEPWTYYHNKIGIGCLDADGATLAHAAFNIHESSSFFSPRELRRATQCVSALAGIADPQGFVREVRELMKDCEGYIAEDTETIRANGTRYCNQCGEDDGSSWCSTCRLMRDIRAMLARLDAGRGK